MDIFKKKKNNKNQIILQYKILFYDIFVNNEMFGKISKYLFIYFINKFVNK